MAVAAYASLVSLKQVLDNLHYRARFHLPRVDKALVKTLQDNVQLLLESVERDSERESPGIDHLWRPMAKIAYEAEDTINFHVVDQLHKRSQGETSDAGLSSFYQDLKTVISEVVSIKNEFLVINQEGNDAGVGELPVAFSPAGGSSVALSGGSNVLVGTAEHVKKIRELLANEGPNLQILPIVGIGGIGKTTLTRCIFDDPCIVDYFHIRVWLTISQEYSSEQILKGFLIEGGGEGKHKSLPESRDELRKKLFKRKFLIVMDDVWSTRVWDDLNRFFPDNGLGSRIMLTTRDSNLGFCKNPYQLTFLDKDKSWNLFCQTTFAQIGCPYDELEDIGKDIANSCRGLPLEIVVIGRLLANSNMSREYWEFVAQNISDFRNSGDDEHCLKTLTLSYKSLPIRLKPCFLHMRVFPEDDWIFVPDLILDWIAEGFIKLENGKSLEESAKQYLKELVDRNLIFYKSPIKCGIHDLLREICLRESEDECLFRSSKVQRVSSDPKKRACCFLCSEPIIFDKECMHPPRPVRIFPSSLHDTPVICEACQMKYSDISRPRLVKTMHVSRNKLWKETVQPIELRCVAIHSYDGLKFASPSALHLLWNLQYLIISYFKLSQIVLPLEIWEMPQLREIRVPFGVFLPDPPATCIDGEDFLVLENLQTLSKVLNFKGIKEITDRIPNLKNLAISYNNDSKEEMEWSNYSLCNLKDLHNLESLSVWGALESISFPDSIRQLSLSECRMTWEDMSMIGSLSHLERLELQWGVEGSEWNPVEGHFTRLKELVIAFTDLACWTADEPHFPVLKRLELYHLDSLEEIPSGIGDIPTLQSITLYQCNDSAIDSAKRMWKEQQDMGNYSLQIHVTGKDHRQYTINGVESLRTEDDDS